MAGVNLPALEKACKIAEIAHVDVAMTAADLRGLLDINAEMLEALKKYADKSNWLVHHDEEIEYAATAEWQGDDDPHPWTIAQAAIAKVEGKNAR